jgi:hypothetical protein
MRKPLFSIVVAAALLSGAGYASAEVTTTTTTSSWTNEQGDLIREYSTTKNYTPVEDKAINVEVGQTLPSKVKVYSLPETVRVENPDKYSYVIVNDHPVVVERSSRKVVHLW